jgi:hypothetical protein
MHFRKRNLTPEQRREFFLEKQRGIGVRGFWSEGPSPTDRPG